MHGDCCIHNACVKGDDQIQDLFGDTQGYKDTEPRRRLRLYSEDVLINWSPRNKDFSLQQQAALVCGMLS